jgi:hypothetical protein
MALKKLSSGVVSGVPSGWGCSYWIVAQNPTLMYGLVFGLDEKNVLTGYPK